MLRCEKCAAPEWFLDFDRRAAEDAVLSRRV
jgi:hypothetical protein